MPPSKQQSHGYTRSYFGEFDAQPLLDWLNRKKRSRKDPIEKLIRLNASVGDIRATILGHDAGEEIRATVADVVSRYKVSVGPIVVDVTPENWEVDWKLVNRKMPPLQGLAFVRLLHTASQGVLDRVRQCLWDKKWFFARFSHQECCSVPCQQKHVRSSKEWKKHKREYMQRLRRTKKLREQKELQLSKTRKGKS